MVEARIVGPDLAREFESLGWRVRILRVGDIGIDSFGGFVRQERPRALLSINHSPELAWLCSREGIPYVSWTVDPLPVQRLSVLEGTRQELTRIFLHRSSQEPAFRALGFPFVEWLPLAAPRHRFAPGPGSGERALPPCFFGSSLLDEAGIFENALARWGIRGGDADIVRGAVDGIAEAALEDASFGGFAAGGGIPARLLEIAREPATLVAEALDARVAATFRRARVVRLAQLGVSVHGDAEWGRLVGGAWKGFLQDGEPLTRVCAGSLACVDVPRVHQRDIATLRAFDVAAAGGCLVAEPSTDLVRLLEPGTEFLPYRGHADLEEILAELRRNPARSFAVGRAARERAMEDHRLESRAERLLSAIA